MSLKRAARRLRAILRRGNFGLLFVAVIAVERFISTAVTGRATAVDLLVWTGIAAVVSLTGLAQSAIPPRSKDTQVIYLLTDKEHDRPPSEPRG